MLTKDIHKIIRDIKSDNIVIIPSDTVYGLSCAISRQAVEKLILIKKRDISKGFIIISSNAEHLLQYIDTDKLKTDQIDTICSYQNSPTTWIVPARDNIQWLTGERDSLAVRLVDNQQVRYICENINKAIISTSANISGNDITNDLQIINMIFSDINILESVKNVNIQHSQIINIVTGARIR